MSAVRDGAHASASVWGISRWFARIIPDSCSVQPPRTNEPAVYHHRRLPPWPRSARIDNFRWPAPPSDRQIPSLPRAQPHRLDDLQHEDLPIPQLPRPRRPLDGVDRLRDHLVLDDHLDLQLRHEVHDVLGAAVELLVPLLAAEALHFADGHAAHSDGVEGLLHLVDPGGPDDRLDFLH